jgi:hypothetical protein
MVRFLYLALLAATVLAQGETPTEYNTAVTESVPAAVEAAAEAAAVAPVVASVGAGSGVETEEVPAAVEAAAEAAVVAPVDAPIGAGSGVEQEVAIEAAAEAAVVAPVVASVGAGSEVEHEEVPAAGSYGASCVDVGIPDEFGIDGGCAEVLAMGACGDEEALEYCACTCLGSDQGGSDAGIDEDGSDANAGAAPTANAGAAPTANPAAGSYAGIDEDGSDADFGAAPTANPAAAPTTPPTFEGAYVVPSITPVGTYAFYRLHMLTHTTGMLIYHCNICCSTSNINDHISFWFANTSIPIPMAALIASLSANIFCSSMLG